MSNSSNIYKKRFTTLLREDNYELMAQSMGGTFKDFMNSLVGKTRQQIFDAGSYAFLYTGNKYGMTNAAHDIKNPEVIMTKFLQLLGNYLNKGLERPRIYETEEFKKKYDYYGEHKRLEKERMELGKKAINAPEGPEKDAARSKFYQFRNDGKYLTARREAIDKEDKEVEKFHSAPLKLEDVQNDGSGDYTKLGLMYQRILRMRKGITEKLNPKKHDAGDYIEDFAKSKAPQFKGKSKKKKREMAVAAYLAAKDEDAQNPSPKVRKNKQGLMGSKTRIHKDKTKYDRKKISKPKEEDDSSYAGGALGPAAAAGNTQGDFYAPGDFRIPKVLGAIQTRRGPIGGKKRRKKKKKK